MDDILSYAEGMNKPFKERAAANLAGLKQQAGMAPTATSAQTAGAFQQQGKVAQQAELDKQVVREASRATKVLAPTIVGMATAGTGLPAALAIMGGTGFGSALAGTGLEKLVGASHATLADMIKEASISGAVGMAGEGLGRGVVMLAKPIAQKFLPQAIIQAADRTDAGRAFLDAKNGELLNSLQAEVSAAGRQVGNKAGKFAVDASGPMQRMAAGLKQIKARGAPFPPPPPVPGAPPVPPTTTFTKAYGGVTEEADRALEALRGSLQQGGAYGGGIESLNALINAKREFQQIVFGPKAREVLGDAAVPVLQKGVQDLNQIIKDGLNVVGSKASKLYESLNDLAKLRTRKDTLESAVADLITRHIAGSTIGAAMGYGLGQTVPIKGAGTTGAIAGALLGRNMVNNYAAKTLAPLVLEQMAIHGGATASMRAAMANLRGGRMGAFFLLGKRALEQSGADDTIERAMSPTLNPEPTPVPRP